MSRPVELWERAVIRRKRCEAGKPGLEKAREKLAAARKANPDRYRRQGTERKCLVKIEWARVEPSSVPKGAQGICPSQAYVADTSIGKVYVVGAPESEDPRWNVYRASGWFLTARGNLRAFMTAEAAFLFVERETRAVARGAT